MAAAQQGLRQGGQRAPTGQTAASGQAHAAKPGRQALLQTQPGALGWVEHVTVRHLAAHLPPAARPHPGRRARGRCRTA